MKDIGEVLSGLKSRYGDVICFIQCDGVISAFGSDAETAAGLLFLDLEDEDYQPGYKELRIGSENLTTHLNAIVDAGHGVMFVTNGGDLL